MARILIAGCGYVGGELAERLLERGDLVWGLKRDPESLPDRVAPCPRDLTRRETLGDLPRSLDAVVYAAGSDASEPEAYRAIYVDGLRNLIDALIAQGQQLSRLLVVTSTAVYAQASGEDVDENSPTTPSSFQGQTMLDSESLALSSPFETAVIRFGGIYGPGRTRMIDQLRRSALTIPAGRSYTNRIHRDDCAGVHMHLLDASTVEPHYVGVDCDPAPRREVVDWIANQLGVPPAAENEEAPAGLNKRCRNRRLLASGYRFEYPTFREGYGSLL